VFFNRYHERREKGGGDTEKWLGSLRVVGEILARGGPKGRRGGGEGVNKDSTKSSRPLNRGRVEAQ